MKTSATFLLVASALAAVLGLAAGSEGGTVSCRARAWVRAPNLVPGKVIQGDVKVKLDGRCDEVSSYRLGLRFAERSWVKTLREGAKLPTKPVNDFTTRDLGQSCSNRTIYDVDRWQINSRGNMTAWDQYERDMKSPELWLVREEERIAFETKYDLTDGPKGTEKLGCDIVQPFALLVPFTNYPPALDNTYRQGSRGGINTASAEHIYKYFVDVTFSNGTQKEVDAGHTSFDALAAAKPNYGPESVNVTARRTRLNKGVLVNDASSDEFTLEVTFPNGTHFEQGSTNNITIVSHQIGPGSQRAFAIETVRSRTQQKRRWAATWAADNKAADQLLRSGMMLGRETQAKLNDQYDQDEYIRRSMHPVVPQFSQEGVVENGTIFSTEPVTAQFYLPAWTYPSLEMYYQSLEHELNVRMRIRNTSEASLPPHAALDDEEYDWTPALRQTERFSYKNTEMVLATIPISVYRKREQQTALSSIVHYLSPEARSPVFMDPSLLPQLLDMTAEDRDTLAPRSQPKTVAKADEAVVKDRYYMTRASRRMQGGYYVGDTWLRKVLARGDHDRDFTQQEHVLVLQPEAEH